jgi:hypothetical protein
MADGRPSARLTRIKQPVIVGGKTPLGDEAERSSPFPKRQAIAPNSTRPVLRTLPWPAVGRNVPEDVEAFAPLDLAKMPSFTREAIMSPVIEAGAVKW